MADGVWSGLLRGFSERTAANRAEAAAETERQIARDQRIFETLAGSDDPEIASAAVQGLLSLAGGTYRPKRALDRFLGGAAPVNPAVANLMGVLRSPVFETIQGPPVSEVVPEAVQARTEADMAQSRPGAAAMAPPPGEAPPPAPGVLQAPGAAPPDIGPMLESVNRAVRPAGSPLATRQVHPGTPTRVARPRQVFLSPEAKARQQARAKAQGDVEGEVAGLIAAGFSENEARDLVKQTYARRAGAGTGFQSIAGELPDGSPAFGVFDRASGEYRDPTTGAPLPGFRPRTTTASLSMGTAREGAAERLFSKRYVQLTPEEKAQADAFATRFTAETAGAQTGARAAAMGEAPLSTQQRFQAITGLQEDWRKIEAPQREMERQFRLMQVGLQRFREGDAIGGSQAILTTFQRILDPQSVVLAAEYARTPQGLGLIQRLEGYVDRLVTGGAGVPEPELAAMVETADRFLAGLADWNLAERDRVVRTAQQFRLDPSLIVGGAAGAGTPPPTPGLEALPPQIREALEKVAVPTGDPFTVVTLTLPNGTSQVWWKFPDGRLERKQ